MAKSETHQERQIRLLVAKIDARWHLLETVNVGASAERICKELDDLRAQLAVAQSYKIIEFERGVAEGYAQSLI